MARTRRRAPAGNPAPRVELCYIDINDIVPYEFNPRDNAPAIASVANSIRSFGFLVPVVVDRENVLVAGHTRVEAAKTLGLSEVPAIRAEHLTPDQIDAFRIIDNKVSELASWNFDYLADEINKLKTSGIVFTEFGFTQEEIDCLSDVVADDCLNTDNLIDANARDRIRRTERRAPATARCVIGEIVFFVPATEYRTWIDGVRNLFDYNEAEIHAELRRRLGMRPES